MTNTHDDAGLRDAEDRELEKSARICELNDALRTDAAHIAIRIARRQLVIARGVLAHGDDFLMRAVDAVRRLQSIHGRQRPLRQARFRLVHARWRRNLLED